MHSRLQLLMYFDFGYKPAQNGYELTEIGYETTGYVTTGYPVLSFYLSLFLQMDNFIKIIRGDRGVGI